MNRVILSGRISNDPETRHSNDGKGYTRFNFAVNRRFKSDGDPEADFFSCVAFGKVSERFDKLNIQKGVKLNIEGEIRNNNYTDRNGVKRFENQILIQEFEFCESKANTAPQEPKKAIDMPTEKFLSVDDGIDDELPFN